MAMLRLQPNSDILTQWEGGYANVDEYPISDSDMDLQRSDSMCYDDFGIPNHTTESGTIHKITVFTKMWWGYDHAVQGYGVNIGGSRYLVAPTVNYGISSNEWTTNPKTSAAWTWADIDALVLTIQGQRGVSSMAYLYCSGIYVEIDYTAAPTVTTQSPGDIDKTTCTGNGNITDTGGANCTRRGFCYKVGTIGDPTTADTVAYDDGDYGMGAYTKAITGLSALTDYRIRAYATGPGGTSYGDTAGFTTLIAATYVEILTADRALALDNTTAFTPDADYEPATKKYVDDQVGGTGNGDMQTATYDTDIDGVVDKAEGVVTGTTLPDTASDGELFGKTDSKELYIWFD